MTIKKAYTEIISFLEENKESKVKTVLNKVIELASVSRRSGEDLYIKNDEGKTVAICDNYYKRWLPLVGDKAVEFGAREGVSGFNTMCRISHAQWNKQQKEARAAREQLLRDVGSRKISVDEIGAIEETIEANRKRVEATDLGFATKEEVEAYLSTIV